MDAVDEKINANAERANMALGSLMDALQGVSAHPDDGVAFSAALDAAKALESAACQLRRALKKKVGS